MSWLILVTLVITLPILVAAREVERVVAMRNELLEEEMVYLRTQMQLIHELILSRDL